MTTPISTLTTPSWTNMSDGQPLPAATLNSGINNANAAIGNLNTVAAELENCFASSSAPTDKPAGKIFFNSSTQQWAGYPVANGTLAPFLTQSAAGSTDVLGASTLTYQFATAAGGQTAWQMSGGAQKTVLVSGVDANSYVSGTGTAGTANTAQTVKSITLKANSLNAVGRGIEIFCVIQGNPSSSIAVALLLNGISLFSFTATSGAAYCFGLSIKYIDATHLYFTALSAGSNPAGYFNPQININTAGFVNGSDQTLAITQSAVSSTAITVYQMFLEQKG